MPQPKEFLDRFEQWTTSLPADLDTTFTLLTDQTIAPQGRRLLGGALSYLLTQLDIIPDHEPAGAVDDAFVLRIAYALSESHAGQASPAVTTLFGRMLNEEELVRSFLGDELYARLRRYVLELADKPVRGRTADQLLSDERARQDLKRELDAAQRRIHPLTAGAAADADALVASIKSFFRIKLGA